MEKETGAAKLTLMSSFSTGVKRRSRIDEFTCEICDRITGWSLCRLVSDEFEIESG